MTILDIYIIEDDIETCTKFTELSKDMPGINIMGYCSNAQKALSYIRKNKPNAIILDLELTNGKGDGLMIIPDIINLYESYKPFILITTNNPSTYIHKHARTLGADYLIAKYQDGYSEAFVLNFLSSLKNTIVPDTNNTPISSYISNKERDKILLSEITDTLNLIGIKPKLKGFNYLKIAIFLVLFEETNNIFEAVGKHYNVKPQSSLRAMQNAIDAAYDDNTSIYRYYTGYCNPKTSIPNALDFIHFFANKIKNNHPELFEY